jgi:hypothetical protein
VALALLGHDAAMAAAAHGRPGQVHPHGAPHTHASSSHVAVTGPTGCGANRSAALRNDPSVQTLAPIAAVSRHVTLRDFLHSATPGANADASPDPTWPPNVRRALLQVYRI